MQVYWKSFISTRMKTLSFEELKVTKNINNSDVVCESRVLQQL